jgi:rod shape-determining protein MreD
VKVAGVILAVAAALVLQTTLVRYLVRGNVAVDLVLVVVVYVGLTMGPTPGLLAGTAGGLVQDALSTGGITGIDGLAKTVVGFLTGLIGTQFIVVQSLPRFVVFFVATVVHQAIFMGLNVLLNIRRFGTPVGDIAEQALANAVIGILAFQVAELLPGALDRRRAAKTRIRR